MNRPQVGVRIFVFNFEANKILVIKNKNDNKWALPGGKLEYSEAFETCAKRELHQVTNINISDLDRFKFICSFNAVDKNIGYHWAEINHLITLTKEEEKLLLLTEESKENDEKVIESKENKSCNWEWVTFDEISKSFSNLYLSLQIFLTKYKIDSLEKILNLKSN